jgi:hypothetical protein
MSEIDITEVRSWADVKIQVHLTGAPPFKVQYQQGREASPSFLSLTYRYLPDHRTNEDNPWACVSVTVGGDRILKPGPNGEQRLGKDQGKASWSTIGTEDIVKSQQGKGRPLPDWIVQLIAELRPYGELSLPAE